MKAKKLSDLRPNTVESSCLHVGIELELRAPTGDECGEREHDDESCHNAYRDMISEAGPIDALQNRFGLTRSEAQSLEGYFNFDDWVDNDCQDFQCEDSECGYWSGGNEGDETREALRIGLKRLTGNASFKVVEDGSVRTEDGQTDAEVCWNYPATKEAVKQNAAILAYLKEKNCNFDKSCGLHINLNNYLAVPCVQIRTAELDFLFNLVAASRRESSYCNQYAMSGEKYSMIYNQHDRLEFRFFSPTLEASKLNHYVTVANVVYRRLAGKDVKLCAKSSAYFLEKMTNVNGLTLERAFDTINRINNILPAASYAIGSTTSVDF